MTLTVNSPWRPVPDKRRVSPIVFEFYVRVQRYDRGSTPAIVHVDFDIRRYRITSTLTLHTRTIRLDYIVHQINSKPETFG